MCRFPRLIINPKYKPNKKNGGQVPPVLDDRVKYVPIGCQRCMDCKRQKANNWRTRLIEDIKTSGKAWMITLTFNTESIKHIASYINPDIDGYERDNAIATQAVRWYLERWRKKYKKSQRHWLVTELGTQRYEHIHLHGIIWCTEEELNTVKEIWKYGYVYDGQYNMEKRINYVNERTMNYIVKYITKMDFKHKYYNPIILTSAGIGKTYTETAQARRNKFKGTETLETYRTGTGNKIALPIYWRNKIYSDEEREKLWLQRLDQQIRWVNGTKIDISKGEERYYKLLKLAQEENNRLGYGNDEKDWNRIEYERIRRNMLHAKRIGNNTNASGGVLTQDIGYAGRKPPGEAEEILINNNIWVITDKGIFQKNR